MLGIKGNEQVHSAGLIYHTLADVTFQGVEMRVGSFLLTSHFLAIVLHCSSFIV